MGPVLAKLLNAFSRSRLENSSLLASLNLTLFAVTAKKPAALSAQPSKRKYFLTKRSRSFSLDSQILSAPLMATKISRLLARWTKTSPPIVVVACSHRTPQLLPEELLHKIIVDQLDEEEGLAGQVRTPPLLILDVNLRSSFTLLESSKEKAVLNYLTLIFFALTTPIFTLAALNDVRRELNDANERPVFRQSAQMLLALTLARLLRLRSHAVGAIFLTSNSTFPEMLRWELLRNSQTLSIVEVLHGVPTLELERYQAALQRIIGPSDYEKQSFIKMVRGIELPEAFKRQRRGVGWLNLKFLSIRESLGKFDDAIARLRRERTDLDVFVVHINGSTGHEMPYVDSAAFLAEKEILSAIVGYATQVGRKLRLSYSSHPAHMKTGEYLLLRRTLTENFAHLTFYTDSALGWLSSDFCISLYSSSAWDARALGCPSFTTIRNRDHIYSKQILDLLDHPGDDESVPDALQRVLIPLLLGPPRTLNHYISRLNGIYFPYKSDF